ncbi:MAG: DUF3576 domain-containing protein [Pseudomonadota bacterium]
MTLSQTSSFKTLSGAPACTRLVLIPALLTACLLAVTGCAGGKDTRNLPLIGAASSSKAGVPTTVNRYLWGATLETINFLPVSSADPIAGLVLTDWYVNPETPDERFKVNVYILDQSLRADALRVSVFRQSLTNGAWIDSRVNPATPRELENAILTRARQLRLNTLDQ